MRVSLFALLISVISSAAAQTSQFNNTFPLRDGIYVTYKELLNNAPSFPNCILLVNANKYEVNKDELSYCFKGMEDQVTPYTSELFAIVEDGKFLIYYQKQLLPVFSKGTLCRFIYSRETTLSYKNQYQAEFKSDMCVLDIQTGEIYKLNKDNLGRSMKRDASLYATYLNTKPGRKNKNLFKYITDFNTKNPTYIAAREQNMVIEE